MELNDEITIPAKLELVYKSLNDIAKNWQADESFNPKIHNSIRKKLIEGWSKAIKKTLS